MFCLILSAGALGYQIPADRILACILASAICIVYLGAGFAIGYVVQGWQLGSIWRRVLLLR
jgi:hypothetical protein